MLQSPKGVLSCGNDVGLAAHYRRKDPPTTNAAIHESFLVTKYLPPRAIFQLVLRIQTMVWLAQSVQHSLEIYLTRHE